MKKHTKIYLDGMKISQTMYFEDMGILCEWCGKLANDVHHIQGRQAGGSKLKDYVENLVALCRDCHLAAEARDIDKDELQAKHLNNIPK